MGVSVSSYHHDDRSVAGEVSCWTSSSSSFFLFSSGFGSCPFTAPAFPFSLASFPKSDTRERVSVTVLLRNSSLSYFPSSLLASCPRSATGENISLTVLFLSSKVSTGSNTSLTVLFLNSKVSCWTSSSSSFFSCGSGSCPFTTSALPFFFLASCPRFATRERVSVTVLLRNSSLSYLSSSFLASCPRSATGENISLTVLFLSSKVSTGSFRSLTVLFLSSKVSCSSPILQLKTLNNRMCKAAQYTTHSPC